MHFLYHGNAMWNWKPNTSSQFEVYNKVYQISNILKHFVSFIKFGTVSGEFSIGRQNRSYGEFKVKERINLTEVPKKYVKKSDIFVTNYKRESM